METNTNKKLSYFLIGGGIGVTLALLFAPKPGSEFREDISNAASNGLEKTRQTVNALKENANSLYDNAVDKAGNYVDKANLYLESAKNKANEVYGAVANKVEEVSENVKSLPHSAQPNISEKNDKANKVNEPKQNAKVNQI